MPHIYLSCRAEREKNRAIENLHCPPLPGQIDLVEMTQQGCQPGYHHGGLSSGRDLNDDEHVSLVRE